MNCPKCGRELSAPGAACLGCLVDASGAASPAPPPVPFVPSPAAPSVVVVPPPSVAPSSPPPPPPSPSAAPPPPPSVPEVALPPLPPAPTVALPPVPVTPAPTVALPPVPATPAPTGALPPVPVAEYLAEPGSPPLPMPVLAPPRERGKRPALVLVVAAIAVVGAAVGAFLATRSDDDASTSPGSVLTSIGDATTSPASATTAPPAVSSTLAAPTTAVSTTVTTLATTTVAPTAPPTTVFDPTAAGPVPPTPPLFGPGNPQVLSEPTPSGIPYANHSSSLAIAQQLGDALANDDWATARRLEPSKAGVSDGQYFTGYDGLDRVSLVLVDARPEGAGYRLLVVSVANERDGARTTFYCLEWSVDPAAGTVVQHNGVVGQIARVDRAISPEEARLDPLLDSAMRNQCVWS